MTAIATGVFKTLAIKRQASLGTIAASGGAGTAQYLRRVKSTLDLDKAGYKSTEILPSQQIRDFRHGIRSVKGVINAEMVQGGYQPFCESICRQVVQGNTATTAITTVAATSTTAGVDLTLSASTWLTYGFLIGDVIKMSGWTAPATANNNNYGIVTGFNAGATIMHVSSLSTNTFVTKAQGDPVNTVTVGKKTWVPLTGQTRDYYTIEHWFGDISQSEVFTDCVVTELAVKIPASGMATMDWTVMGLNQITNTVQYFNAPAAVSTGGILASANGAVLVNGVQYGIVTSIDFNVKGGYTAVGGVVGSNVDPDIIPGTVDISGTVTVLFQDNTFRDLFINETEFSIAVALSTGTAANAGFTAFVMPRVKATKATKDDGTGKLSLTIPFQALEQINGGTGTQWLDTTLSIQDASFA